MRRRPDAASWTTWWYRAVASALPFMTLAAIPLAEPADAAPPQIVSESPSALATSVQTSAGTWATVPMGHLDQPLNTFWQLFFRARGTSSWSNATSTLALATNGGLIIATPDGQSVEVGIRPAKSLDVLDATHRLTDTVIVDHWIASGWPGRRQQPCHRLPQRELGGSPERRRRCACGLERTGPFDPADADDRSGVGLIVGRTSLGSRLRHCSWLRRDPSLDRWSMPACRHGMPVSFRTSREQPRPRTDCYGPFSTRPCMTNSSSNLPAECRRPERIVLSNARYQRSPRCRHSLRRCPRTCVWPSPWRPGEGCGEARYPHYGAETLTLFGRRCASNVHRWN